MITCEVLYRMVKHNSESNPSYDRRIQAEALLELEGRPFRLDDFPFYIPIYETQYTQTVLMCGRQVAKSTTMVVRAITNSISMPHFKTLYVAPSKKQASVWSASRLDPMIKHSPDVYYNFALGDTIQNRSHKRFSNGSEVRVGYAKDNPDRIRSISADEVDYDEVQDMVLKNIVPVISECMGNSDYGWEFFAGTPKTLDNPIESLWQESTQDKWVIPCEACGKWSVPDTEKMVGKYGIVCLGCGKYINARHGQWHSFNKNGKLKGYHVSQLCLPANSEKPDRWKRILRKFDNPTYTDTKIKNEVLGVSDSTGTRMVGIEHLRRCEKPYKISYEPKSILFKNIRACVAGIDWSGGGSDLYTSRTVVWVWGIMLDGTLKTMYRKIFATRNPVQDVREILEILTKYDVKYVVGDAGGGAMANAMLAEEYGESRVAQVQYSASSTYQMKWNKRDRYIVDKTSAVDSFMKRIMMREVHYPKNQCETAFTDILAEFEHITKNGDGKRIWTHSPHQPDDALHAQVFGWLASQLYTGEVKFYPYCLYES